MAAPSPPSTPAALAGPRMGVRLRRPVHPGCFLERHYLRPLALSQSEAARRLGVSRRRLHELVHGARRMSPDTALRCAELFGLAASHWLALQSDWDNWQAWQHMQARPRGPGRQDRTGRPLQPLILADAR